MTNAEFDGQRAKLYEKALTEQPLARQMDIDTMEKLLNPKKEEKILGFGEGNGYFCKDIAEAVNKKGYYLITDPSKDQLENLKKKINFTQVEFKVIGAEGLDVTSNFFDKAWSFGAFHHVQDKQEAMNRIHNSLKEKGMLVICDVFKGTKLAEHFDTQVTKYCITGHDVEFMSDESAKKLCEKAGFKEIKIIDLPQKWVFDSEQELGQFIYDLHALTLIPGTDEDKIKETLRGCKEILGIEEQNGKYYLNWPMKALIAIK